MVHGAVAFTCVNCGAPTSYTPAGLSCDACGSIRAIDPLPGKLRGRTLRPVFYAVSDEPPPVPDELELQLRCPKCGGGATYAGTLRASVCPFCAAPVALEHVREPGGRISVDGVIPFRVDEAVAHRAARRWIARAWFAPRGFRLRTRATHYARVYLPVLTIDARLDVEYATAGVIRRDYGLVTGDVHSVVVPLCTQVDQQQLDDFRPWQLQHTVAYRPEYLAGTFCASYDHALSAIRELVQDALAAGAKS